MAAVVAVLVMTQAATPHADALTHHGGEGLAVSVATDAEGMIGNNGEDCSDPANADHPAHLTADLDLLVEGLPSFTKVVRVQAGQVTFTGPLLDVRDYSEDHFTYSLPSPPFTLTIPASVDPDGQSLFCGDLNDAHSLTVEVDALGNDSSGHPVVDQVTFDVPLLPPILDGELVSQPVALRGTGAPCAADAPNPGEPARLTGPITIVITAVPEHTTALGVAVGTVDDISRNGESSIPAGNSLPVTITVPADTPLTCASTTFGTSLSVLVTAYDGNVESGSLGFFVELSNID